MTPIIERVVEKMEELPAQAQALVLVYAESLGTQYAAFPYTANPYPLRGIGVADIDPSMPVVPAEDWNAVSGVLIDDSN